MRFIYYWFPCFTKEESNVFLNEVEDIHKNNPNNLMDNPATGKNLSEVKILPASLLPKIFNRFYNRVLEINEENFGFKLFKQNPKVAHLNYYSEKDSAEYPFHIDASITGTYHDIKLTGIINLSRTDYTGGDFKFLINQNPINIQEINITGNAIVFPSFFLHAVDPVIRGERISLSTWFYGPNWK